MFPFFELIEGGCFLGVPPFGPPFFFSLPFFLLKPWTDKPGPPPMADASPLTKRPFRVMPAVCRLLGLFLFEGNSFRGSQLLALLSPFCRGGALCSLSSPLPDSPPRLACRCTRIFHPLAGSLLPGVRRDFFFSLLSFSPLENRLGVPGVRNLVLQSLGLVHGFFPPFPFATSLGLRLSDRKPSCLPSVPSHPAMF